MKKAYFYPAWSQTPPKGKTYIDAYQEKDLFLYKDSDGFWSISHISGFKVCDAQSFKYGKEIIKHLYSLVQDWSDAALESTGEKYFEVRRFVTWPNLCKLP